jgi:lactam utilization protein B
VTPVTRTTARTAALIGIVGVAGWSLASCAAESAIGESDVAYADGSYTADGDYVAPSGQESITVELTIEDDVVGKDIDELTVSRVAGSSLTSSGFNAALDDIKRQAVAG